MLCFKSGFELYSRWVPLAYVANESTIIILYFYSNDIPLVSVCLFVCFYFVVVQFIVCLNYFLFIPSKDPQTRTRRQRTVLGSSIRHQGRAQEIDDLKALTHGGLPVVCQQRIYGFLKAYG